MARGTLGDDGTMPGEHTSMALGTTGGTGTMLGGHASVALGATDGTGTVLGGCAGMALGTTGGTGTVPGDSPEEEHEGLEEGAEVVVLGDGRLIILLLNANVAEDLGGAPGWLRGGGGLGQAAGGPGEGRGLSPASR